MGKETTTETNHNQPAYPYIDCVSRVLTMMGLSDRELRKVINHEEGCIRMSASNQLYVSVPGDSEETWLSLIDRMAQELQHNKNPLSEINALRAQRVLAPLIILVSGLPDPSGRPESRRRKKRSRGQPFSKKSAKAGAKLGQYHRSKRAGRRGPGRYSRG